MRTALLADPISKQHLTGPGHPERPERFDAALSGTEGLDLLRLPPRKAVEQEDERTVGGACRERVKAQAPRRYRRVPRRHEDGA